MGVFYKVISSVIILIVMGFLFPIVKDWYDVFTAPVTGLMITSGDVPEVVIAAMTFLPWLLPITTVLTLLIWIVTPDEPQMPSYPSLRLPRQTKKKQPPLI